MQALAEVEALVPHQLRLRLLGVRPSAVDKWAAGPVV